VKVLVRVRFKIVVIIVAWAFFFISYVVLATLFVVIALFLLVAFTLLLCIGLLFPALGLLYCVDVVASHCCYIVVLLFCVVALRCYCFALLLFRGGVVAPHWWYCFIMMSQIHIGAIAPYYYFALKLLLFLWLKWYPPLVVCKWELGTHSTKLLTKFNVIFFSFFIWGFFHLFVSFFHFFIVPMSCFFWFFSI